jgi:uncharacterized protein (DUF1015 family)
MAEIRPFKGIIYNQDIIGSMTDVVTPPFDIISPKEQELFHQKHPHNIIRLILGQVSPDDTPDNNRYTRAAAYFDQWLAQAVILQDERPALYLTSMEFRVRNQKTTRYGFITLVKLEPFEKGIILPHERTFSNVRSERLELMKASHTNFSPIFALYPDGNGLMGKMQTDVAGQTPVMDFTETLGFRHRMWRITDPDLHQHAVRALQPKKIFIADGHHRYETALNYRDWIAKTTPDFTPTHPANYVMMYLCGMDDPGLIIRSAHRMLKEVPAEALVTLPDRAAEFFDIETFDFQPDNLTQVQNAFFRSLKANSAQNAIGFLAKNTHTFYRLVLKPGVMAHLFSDELAEALLAIDVTVLTRLIFMELLGFDKHRLDNEKLIGYASRAKNAVQAVLTGEYDVTFILNPTRIDQVQAIAEAGLIMPRKATYFFPKVIAGQVMNSLKP